MLNGGLDVKLMDVAAGRFIDAVIEPLMVKDLTVIRKSKDRFDKFDWNKYKAKEVYKLKLKENELIVGLMCLFEHEDPTIDAVEIELLEVSAENIGKRKSFDYIGGCLIAFACRESFKRGHQGCVFLIPKTSLIDHYISKYGFKYEPIKAPGRPDGFMVHYDTGARRIIREFLDRKPA
ncbi:hypothetical protein [Chitinophaga sp. S165]|uniref:hypothetical protein n=1 Tax=Chitinophaga sp. S165 TaxID=2135462 RepID=UPI000D70A59C|nr:hypothetical protein [Chitinophaga sp. S165]PWV44852.1 hypothetical protein C7475_11715 [Chitinophaga sp. S165]